MLAGSTLFTLDLGRYNGVSRLIRNMTFATLPCHASPGSTTSTRSNRGGSIGANGPGQTRRYRAAEKVLPELQPQLVRTADFFLCREGLSWRRTTYRAHRGAVVGIGDHGDRMAWNREVEWHRALLGWGRLAV